MFSRLQGLGNHNARFYQVPANIEEVRSGYMYKSPSEHLMKSVKSWKRRYFVLSKNPENKYELKFFKDENKREKPMGTINIYQITLIFRQMKSESIWLWIQKNFKCSATCVLYMKVAAREYFLIGENSTEMDEWFDAIFKALNTQIFIQPDREVPLTKPTRSMSEPLSVTWHDQNLSEEQEQKETELIAVRQSAPESFNSQYCHTGHYDYPKKFQMKPSQSLDTDEDEDDEIKVDKECETKEDSSIYMHMENVKGILRQTQSHEGVSFPKSILKGNSVSENTFLPINNDDATAPNRQILHKSEIPFTPVKEICISHDELRNSVVFSEKAGKIRVSSWSHTQFSGLFQEGDQILAINDLRTDSLVALQTYLRKLTKDQVKVTILRQPRSQSIGGCCT
ncbi:pleckstrin homology domain-containing family S member 1-like [Silurus meridionalis]|uniref:PH domain-containing protein n=1 Tax=Silurus meridionalis TaxID=175797 RepID=A0A8T0BEF5_SILME|nr:pleckstrin homology domain-containing family S member 1-like [Silurus meridionalis]XP_046709583.1 pleckstrin homology domain-containing family S member 1-like [Silurus meridionalis]KAF7705375.1 hypothetical protein HF521_020661 [Silurus meridionalis]